MYERVRRAWAAMLGVEELRTQVVVRTESPFAPPGWVSLVRIGDALTVTVPDATLVDTFDTALAGLDAIDAVDLGVLRSRLPIADVLGPSSLFYLVAPLELPPAVDVVDVPAVAALLDAAPKADRDEAGIEHVSSGLSVVRGDDGVPIAACGATSWPQDIAHLCVLTHPEHRGRGHGRTVGQHAAVRAQRDGLIPQWRARVEASRAVARGIGFEELGTQLRVLLA